MVTNGKTNKKEEKTMKKFYAILATLAMVAGFASCSSDSEILDQPQTSEVAPRTMVVKAYIDNPSTRTTLVDSGENKGTVLWSEGDVIVLRSNENFNNLYRFVLTDGAGTTSGEFSLADGEATPADGGYMVFYPEDYYSDDKHQTYKGPNDISFAPMFSDNIVNIQDGNVDDITFKNYHSLLRYKVKGDPTIKIKTITFSGINSVGDHCEIILDCGDEGVALSEEGVFFNFSVLYYTYHDVKLHFETVDYRECTKVYKNNLKVEKNTVLETTLSINPTWKEGRQLTIGDTEGIIMKILVGTHDTWYFAVALNNFKVDGRRPDSEYFSYDEVLSYKNSIDPAAPGWKIPKDELAESFIKAYHVDDLPYTTESNVHVEFYNYGQPGGGLKFTFANGNELFIAAKGSYAEHNNKRGFYWVDNNGNSTYPMCMMFTQGTYNVTGNDGINRDLKSGVYTAYGIGSALGEIYETIPLCIRPFYDLGVVTDR